MIAGGKVQPGPVDQSVVIRMDELGPPEPDASPWQAVGSGRGRQGFSTGAPARDPGGGLHTRLNGVRHLMAGYDLSRDKLYGQVTNHKGRAEFLSFRHFSRSPHLKEVRIAIVLDNVSTHRSAMKDSRAGQWAKDNNVELT